MKIHLFLIKDTAHTIELENMIVSSMHGYHYLIRYTQSKEHIKELLEEYKYFSIRIYVCGGDGMVHYVAQQIVNTQNEMVVLPMGSGNDFSRVVNHTNDLKTIIEEAKHKESAYIDVIQANDIYCVNTFCVAFDSVIGNQVNEKGKSKFIPGSLQYAALFFKKVINFKLYDTTLTIGEECVYKKPLIIGAFCNGQYYGGGFHIAVDAELQDGYFDATLISAFRKSAIPKYLLLLATKKLKQGKSVTITKYKEICIESVIDVNIDGEQYPGGKYDLKILPKSLRVVLMN